MESNNTITASNSRIRMAIFCLYFCTGICFSSWASRIPDIKTTLGLGDAAWGTILLMIPIGQVCGMAISGFLVSKLGSKRILPVALIGYVAALLLVGVSSSEYALIISLIVFGFFGNFCNISINTQSVTVEAMYNKPIMASFHGGWSLAGLTGAAIGLLMSSLHLKPVYHFGIIGVLVIITLIVNKRYLQPDHKKEKDPAEIAAKKKCKPETFLFLLGMVAFCGMAAEGAMADWSGLYLIDVVGTPKHLAPIGLAAYMVTMASGRFMIDKATQKWGRKRIVQTGGILIATGLFTAVAFPHFITTIIAFMIIGFGTAGIVPTIYSIAGQKTRIPTSIALTIVSSVSFLGFLMGPPLIGYISSATNLRYSYALIGLFGICIVVLASVIKVFRKEAPLPPEEGNPQNSI
ncbi:MFS family permease [Dysgonomonas sp. PFB1-18]|uniref:MFS transporter n=1 Tax=unclassified Dysgonomonas TaxID=2630389 RepID=UPI0024744E19|nr:MULTISPECIES: MFS transporter [unclassified Dysgonomonas]MDH6309818.1 MFS family permease [Dysgonomonas sp. PF1-14]MDH6339362.1 MFS family permease [Dysgonomonas sp. PF1-16]MDH6380861.1 MFS family permease [Dysgonomonas sp. PFB1-18]MDH6397870.1 MFS family permease [Dysgonomonas sp. PF1-23]